jgi:hypothetical protein
MGQAGRHQRVARRRQTGGAAASASRRLATSGPEATETKARRGLVMEPTPAASLTPRQRRRRFILLIALAAFAAITGVEIYILVEMNAEPPIHLSFQGKSPSEFPASGSWIGAPQPLDFAALRGQVIYIQFSFIH